MKRYISTLKDAISIAPGKTSWIIQMFLSSIMNHISSLLPPIATAGIIKVITNNNFNGIWFYVFLYILFYGLYFFSYYWNYHTYGLLGRYYPIATKKKIIQKVADNENIFSKVSKGKILNSCSDDVDYIVDIIDTFVEFVISAFKLIIIFFIFAYYNIFVAIIAILIDFVYLKIMNDNCKMAALHYEGIKKNNDKIMDLVNQILFNIKKINDLNIYPNLHKKLEKQMHQWEKEYKSRRQYMTERYALIPIILYVGKLFLYIFLGYLVVKQKLTIDILILLISYFELTISTSDDMLENLLDFTDYSIRIKRIKSILNVKNENINDFGTLENDYIKGIVEFDHVVCKNNNKLVLNNVSFIIYPNEINTILSNNENDINKILQLLYRNELPKKGKIYIDNANIYDYSQKVYASNLSSIDQKPLIFEMSIKDNLSLVNNNFDEIKEVCKQIGLDKVIMKLPNEYNTKLNIEKNILNDFHQQLLMIARAILSKAEILIFDNPAKNLDNKSTNEIKKIINELKDNHTIILISNNPNLLDLTTRIILLNNGKMMAQGPITEIKEKCLYYKELQN